MSKTETRERILTAAEVLFSQNGYDGTATKSIAVEAGVTEMTLYNHFTNKQLLYKTLVKERFLAVELQSVFMELTYEDLKSDLQKIADSLLINYRSNKNILSMRIKERNSLLDDKTFVMDNDPLIKLMVPVFEIYSKKGIVKGTGRENAMLFASNMKGLFYVSLIDEKGEAEIRTLIDDYITMICDGMIYRKAM